MSNQLQRPAPRTRAGPGARSCRQVDKGDGRLQQLMQRQPQIFDVALLREIESQQKERQNHQQNGINQARQALEKAVRPTTVPASASGRPGCRGEVCDWRRSWCRRCSRRECIDVRTTRVSEVSIGRHVEVVDARDLLIVLRCVAVRAFGLNLLARWRRHPEPVIRRAEALMCFA